MPTPPDPNLKGRFFDAFASRPRPLVGQILRPALNRDGDRLSVFLADKTSADLTAHELRAEVEGYLWMLSVEAFRYFLPAFLYVSLKNYKSISVFVSELVGALTEPARADVSAALDRMAQIPPGLGLPGDMTALLQKQQLEWFDSGTPAAIFHERFDGLTAAEGAAILAFFAALQEAHGEDFPFGELGIAVNRCWSRYKVF